MGQAALKKIKVESELLTDIERLLIVKKLIRRRIYHSINRYTKDNNKYMKDYNKNKQSLYLKYWIFSGLNIFLNLMKASEKVKIKKVKKDIFLKLIFNNLKIYMMSKNIFLLI